MKPHGTFVLTLARLQAVYACEEGLAAVKRRLPALLSTDPEKNIELAVWLCSRNAGQYARWLAGQISKAPVDWWWGARVSGEGHGYVYDRACRDPYVVAQWLAHVADVALSERGR